MPLTQPFQLDTGVIASSTPPGPFASGGMTSSRSQVDGTRGSAVGDWQLRYAAL